MKLTIAGIHMETGDSLKTHCEEKMLTLKKYFDQVIEVGIAFSEESVKPQVEVTVYVSGIHLRAMGEGGDFYKAVDDATQKLERQLKKYKGKLLKHRRRRQKYAEKLEALGSIDAINYTVPEEEDNEEDVEDWISEYAPKVEYKEVTHVEAMSADEAIMQMDLLHKPAYLFQNVQTGILNVVYREEDGTVRWISPKQS